VGIFFDPRKDKIKGGGKSSSRRGLQSGLQEGKTKRGVSSNVKGGNKTTKKRRRPEKEGGMWISPSKKSHGFDRRLFTKKRY